MAQRPDGESGRRRVEAQLREVGANLRTRSGSTLRQRWSRTRSSTVVAAQSAVAAGLAWLAATHLLRHPQPIFAPTAAVIVLDISVGQRLRRAFELVLGVALGIAVGDTLIFGIGTGAWQVGLVVFLASLLAMFLAGSAPVVVQAATSAVLIATLAPPKKGIYYLRFEDALLGGLIAVGVLAVLLPANPLSVVARKAGPACAVLADGLDQTARALAARDAGEADTALTRLRAGGSRLSEFRETLPESRETAWVSPLRWRARGALTRYSDAAVYLERALNNAEALARRSVTAIRDEESLPEQLPRSVSTVAAATRELCRALTTRGPGHGVAEMAVRSVSEAAEAYRMGLGFSGSAVVAQLRAIATDLLGTMNLSHDEANELVRRAGGTPTKP